MGHLSEEEKILKACIDLLKKTVDAKEFRLCAEFTRQFFGTIALEDLKTWSLENLCGAALHFWKTIQTRRPGETKLCIYHPTQAKDGFETPHTLIELITDDAPFLVDSMRMTITRLGLSSHLIVHMGGLRLSRNSKHQITHIYPKRGELLPEIMIDAPIFIEIDQQTDPETLTTLHETLLKVLEDNHCVVNDWQAMREKIRESILELDHAPSSLDPAEIEETKLFLEWIGNHHFTLLGMRDDALIQDGAETFLQAIPSTGLGVLRCKKNQSISVRHVSAMPPEAQELSLSPHILVVSKTNTRATVHRDAYTDYIGIKRFNAQGQVIGERRIIGLYTSAAYNMSPKHIPFLRHKVASIMQNSLLNPRSHAGKVLMNILETFPRDDLIQASEEELLELCMGIFHMQERRRIRMFARMDVYRRFVSCLIYVPKDRFNAELRRTMQSILQARFHAKEITFSTHFSESVLARIHYMIRLQPDDKQHYDFKAIEQTIIQAGRSWSDDFLHHLLQTFPQEKANHYFKHYRNAFSAIYRSSFSPEIAVSDIQNIEALTDQHHLGIRLQPSTTTAPYHFKLRLYRRDQTLALSDILPSLENMGMRVISERPYLLQLENQQEIWIIEFSLIYTEGHLEHLEKMCELFEQTLQELWSGTSENDGFNRLVLAAGLQYREVAMLRTYAKYFKQIGFKFSQDYIESALFHHPAIAQQLVQLFHYRFSPTMHAIEPQETLEKAILKALDHVSNLDEDKIIRHYIHVILATVRTNFYQNKSYISMKIHSQSIPDLPKPVPLFEIFVYAPRFEGIHLRCAKVARGGLRWSDRKEDFRTEILGLMKAQQVKNAVIVPSGAKGGFVTKMLPAQGSREAILQEGIACYEEFIQGLLDLTDNYHDGVIVKPVHTICHDEDDPYLVVAADKGTATFSDIANRIAAQYQFWLGDAFASGGSQGYDHKKIGITARGAWESVKRHFYSMGIDPQQTPFTVVGIGDMAGDVFGNGMLLSKHIQLIAAFNHQHIFIDPHPNTQVSFKERSRLFNLPRSTWEDYDASLISQGGGVFDRRAKSISVSKEMKQLFHIKTSSIEPNELIRLILQAPVDLLWSAGIGTFVKHSEESHVDVGDKTNDSIRINAQDLRVKIVGEGGNLGLTQRARIEYALQGGRIYTDFIDNAGGVHCSDKEVNIKILLHQATESHKLSTQKRNALLASMTDEVAELVLRDNALQTRAIQLIASQAPSAIDLHCRYLQALEQQGKLDRVLDCIPDEKTLLERKQHHQGLTMPEIATLLSQSKIQLKEALLNSHVPEEPFFRNYLMTAFPKPLQVQYHAMMDHHPLKREIISTRLSNLLVNEMGFSFIYRMIHETGATIPAIMCAYIVARETLDMTTLWHDIEALDHQVASETQLMLMTLCTRLLRRVTCWILRHHRTRLDMTETMQHYRPHIERLKQACPQFLGAHQQKHYDDQIQTYKTQGISESLAKTLAKIPMLFSAMDIIDIAQENQLDVLESAEIYFSIEDFLDLTWIRSQVIMHPSENHWEALSREALRDDLDWQQRQLTSGIIQHTSHHRSVRMCLETWATQQAELIDRWHRILNDLKSSHSLNHTMFFVAIRSLLELTHMTRQTTTSS